MKFIANQDEFKLIMELKALLDDETTLLEATRDIVEAPLPPVSEGETDQPVNTPTNVVPTENVITSSVDEIKEDGIDVEELIRLSRTTIIKHNRIANILNELFDLKGTSKNSYGNRANTNRPNKPKYNNHNKYYGSNSFENKE